MNMKLSAIEIEDLIKRLKKGENIHDDYKYKLFPAKQKEYELVYGGKMRKKDVLANEDGVFHVPLQVEKIFNGKRKAWDDGWRNIIAFGDNLQFLKTIYENKAKLKYGVQHFKDLNKELEKLKIDEKYHFHFLSPNSFDVFFDHLRNGKLIQYDFKSDLEDKLLEKNDE